MTTNRPELSRILLLAGCLVIATPALQAAVNIVQCEDDQGEITFQKTCPPGTTQVGQKRVSTGAATEADQKSDRNTAGGQQISALLYTANECGEPCAKVRSYLSERNVSITEKNATDDWDIQNEIKQLIGTLKVPVTKIGNNTITGYNEAALRTALNAAGYTEAESNEEEAASESGDAGTSQ